LVAAGLGFLLLSGCATIFSGAQQEVRVQSNAPGAVAQSATGQVQLPGSLKLRRGERASLQVSATGYVTRSVSPKRQANPEVAINCLCGPFGLLGLIVDVASGSAYEYPKQIFVRVQPDLSAGGAPLASAASPFGATGTGAAASQATGTQRSAYGSAGASEEAPWSSPQAAQGTQSGVSGGSVLAQDPRRGDWSGLPPRRRVTPAPSKPKLSRTPLRIGPERPSDEVGERHRIEGPPPLPTPPEEGLQIMLHSSAPQPI